MASSESSICNLALLRIGVTKTIDALADPGTEAEACAIIYPQAKDALLETFPWPFATRRATLAAHASLKRDGWEYVFALPDDCLVPREVWSGARFPPVSGAVPYAIEDDAVQGRVLLCNVNAPVLIYTSKMTSEPGKFPPLFVDALVWSVASELAMSLPIKEGVQVRAKQGFEMALSRAKAAVLNQQFDTPPDPPSIAARWR